MEALLDLATRLGAMSSKKRAYALQEGLECINEFFLSDRAQGSDLIYVPFGGSFHQARRAFDSVEGLITLVMLGQEGRPWLFRGTVPPIVTYTRLRCFDGRGPVERTELVRRLIGCLSGATSRG